MWLQKHKRSDCFSISGRGEKENTGKWDKEKEEKENEEKEWDKEEEKENEEEEEDKGEVGKREEENTAENNKIWNQRNIVGSTII